VLALTAAVRGATHPSLVPLLQTVTDGYIARTQWAKAAETAQRALAIQEQAGGKDDPRLIPLLQRAVAIYRALDRPADADAAAGRLAALQPARTPPRP